jgi:hypothetical protein
MAHELDARHTHDADCIAQDDFANLLRDASKSKDSLLGQLDGPLDGWFKEEAVVPTLPGEYEEPNQPLEPVSARDPINDLGALLLDMSVASPPLPSHSTPGCEVPLEREVPLQSDSLFPTAVCLTPRCLFNGAPAPMACPGRCLSTTPRAFYADRSLMTPLWLSCRRALPLPL